jgi:hypothetical protein
MFANNEINSDALFKEFLDELFPSYTSALVEQVEFYLIEEYEGPNEWFPRKARLATFLRDAVITCNIRWVSQAYSGLKDSKYPGSYNMIYETVPLIQGADLMPHFLDDKDLFSNINITLVSKFMNTTRTILFPFTRPVTPTHGTMPTPILVPDGKKSRVRCAPSCHI